MKLKRSQILKAREAVLSRMLKAENQKSLMDATGCIAFSNSYTIIEAVLHDCIKRKSSTLEMVELLSCIEFPDNDFMECF